MAARTKITTRILRRANACDSQVELFRDTFGSEAVLTLPNMRKAIAAGLLVSWLSRFLKGDKYYSYQNEACNLPEQEEFNRISEAREKAEHTVWRAYRRAEEKYVYGSTGLYKARYRRDTKICKLNDEYRPLFTEAKTALDLAKGKLLLKYLRKA